MSSFDDRAEGVDWARFEGPAWYRPTEVPGALGALARAASAEDGRAAYDAVMFAIGNNHAGRLYPAAAAAIPFVVDAATGGATQARLTAMDILIDVLTSFEAEAGFGALANGRPLMGAVVQPIVDCRDAFAAAADRAATAEERDKTAELLAAIDDRADS